MFGFMKNKAIELAISDLDKCIFFLTYESQDPKKDANATGFLILSGIMESKSTGITTGAVSEKYKKIKNEAIQKHRLANVKHRDFAVPYVVSTFFLVAGLVEHSNAKIAMSKILNYLKSYADDELNTKIYNLL